MSPSYSRQLNRSPPELPPFLDFRRSKGRSQDSMYRYDVTPAESAMTDFELLKRFADRSDEAAFAEIVRHHGPMVLGICRRVLSNAADAEDAFQATFLVLAGKARSIRRPQLLGNWLFGVALRVSRSNRRRSRQRQLAEKQVMTKEQKAASAAENAADAELVAILDEEVHRLSEKLRQVVVLCYLQGKTKREAADHLGWPEGTVATRLSQAREILRKRLGIRGFAVSSAALSSTLTSALAPVAVSQLLTSSTAQAATLFAAGNLAAVGAASAKAVGLAKSFSNAMLAIKIKIAALVVIGCSLALATGVALSQSRPQPAQAGPTPQKSTPPTQTEADIAVHRALAVTLAISLYQQRHDWHYPPDLGATLPYLPWPKEKALSYILPADEPGLELPEQPTPQWINEHTSFIYLGNANLTDDDLRRFKGGGTAIVFQKPNPSSRRPIAVGFVGGSGAWWPPAQVKELVQEMVENLATLGQTTAPAEQHKAQSLLANFPPDILPNLPEPAIPDPALTIPAELRTALEKNAAALSPISITWTAQGLSTSTMQQAISDYFVGGAENSLFETWRHQLDWQTGGVHALGASPKGDFNETAFSDQGLAFANYHPKPGLLKRKVNLRSLDEAMKNSPDSLRFQDEYLFNAGLRPPSTAREFSANLAQSRILWRLAHGAAIGAIDETTLDGRKLTRLDLIDDNPDRYQLKKLPQKQTFAFYLDPQMNYAVRRMEQRYGKQLAYVARNEHFERLSGRDLWLPRKSYTDFYTFYRIPDQFFDHPILMQVREVAKIDLSEIPHERFVLREEIPPPEQLEFASAATSETSVADSKPAAAIANATPPRASPTTSWLSSPVAAVGALAALLLLALLGRVALGRMIERGR